MNKHLYRVIFNHARGCLMVVGELARISRGHASVSRRRSGTTRPWARLNSLSLFTHLALGATVLLTPVVQADIVANSAAPLNQQPTVTTTANGITQINIQTPNASGLSYNRYSRFDVDPAGAILNNARVLTQTQLGGLVLGNPNLATGTAQVILNEVNASDPSQLRGFLEVAGDRAQVIVANPAGIICDGCGFINVDRATLTTGAPVLNGGNLEAYVVRRGVVSIEGEGLNASQTNFTEIIARSVRINASLHASDLRITTGANRVNAANTTAQQISGEGDVPEYALDVSELGGMYAGKIRLVGTELGLGVRNAGSIGASAGSFELTAAGRLVNSGDITATTTVAINTTEGIDNSGTIAAGGLLDIDSDGELVNRGNGALFGDDVDIDVATVSNRAEDGRSAVIAARNDLTIDADEIENRDGALLYSGGDITLSITTLNNNSGLIDADGDITITATTINNTNENFQTRLAFRSQENIQEFALVGSPNRYRPDQVSLRPDRNDDVNFLVTPEGEDDAYNRFDYTRRVDETEIVSSDPAQIRAGGAINITADTVINDNSRVIAGGDLTANIGNLINTETSGQRITGENGTLTTFTRRNRKGSDSTRVRVSTYAPAPREERFSLNQAAFAGQIQGEANRTDVPLSNSALFRNEPNSAAGFLIETDPRFINQRMFLSSDFVLDQLAFDPTVTQKRLGDGFYEQRLVREQVAQLLGRRFIQGFADDESQYQALLNSGITAVNEFNLRPGIVLSSEQVAQLTSDVVLLIEREVTLPNGTLTRALVPQLYLRPQAGDLNGNGGLLAAAQITINATQTIQNAASIIAQEQTTLTAKTILTQGGDIRAANTTLMAQEDILLQGGTLQGDDSLSLTAGRDIIARSSVSIQTGAQGSRQNINRRVSLFVTNAQSILLASAGRDIVLDGIDIVQTGAAGQTQLSAGRDIQLGTVTERLQQAVVHDANNFRREQSDIDVGSRIVAEGDITLTAGRDISTRAANLRSDNANITLSASDTITLNVGRNKTRLDEGVKNKSKGFLSSTTRTRRDTVEQDSSIASVLSADNVTLQANNIGITGSSVVATQALSLNAQQEITITAATDTRLELNLREKKKSGLFSSGGLGVTLGTQQLNVDTSTQVASAAGSTLGSIEEDVNIIAGGDFTQAGSQVAAPAGDINITAENIDIVAEENTSITVQETKFKQSGLSVSISNPILDGLQTIKRVQKAKEKTKSSRLKKLGTATQVLAALNAFEKVEARLATVAREAIDKGDEAAKDTNTGDKAKDAAANRASAVDKVGGINISISIGSSKSQSKTVQTSTNVVSSTLVAGNDINLIARGERGDITLRGSEILASSDAILQAAGDIKLLAAANISTLDRKNSSSSASVGFSYGTNGFAVNASVSKGKGKADGDDLTFTNAGIDAGKGVALISGNDTILRGAVVSGEQIVAEVGGDLTIASLQDVSTFSSKESTSGLSISIPISPGAISGSLSASKSKVNADFASVVEQTGFRAGDKGFQINVAGNTDLRGAIVASTELAEQLGNNELITGTLTVSSIRNREEVESSQSGLSLSLGPLTKYKIAKSVAGNLIKGTDESTDQSSTTFSGVSTSNIQITDEEKQLQTGKSAETVIASLSKDVASDKDSSNALIKTDVTQVEAELRAGTILKEELFKQVTVITDDAYKTLFERTPKFYKITCPAGANCTKNPERAIATQVTAEEVAKNGNNDTVVAVNGVFNGLERAGELAYQNVESVDKTEQNPKGNKPENIYLVHYVPAGGFIGELIATGYEKLLTQVDYDTASALGFSNVDIAYAETLRSRGNLKTESLGHSRGTIVQQNAFNILGNERDSSGATFTNENLTVRSVGIAVNVTEIAEQARRLKVDPDNIRASYFDSDPVTGFITNNPTVSSFGALFRALVEAYRFSNSVHSCAGTGAVGCNQVEFVVPGGNQGSPEGNESLRTFKNGQEVNRTTQN